MKIHESKADATPVCQVAASVRVFHPLLGAARRDGESEGLMAENTADFVAGWASGAVATLCTQPVDLVITRLQAGAHCSPTPSASNGPFRT